MFSSDIPSHFFLSLYVSSVFSNVFIYESKSAITKNSSLYFVSSSYIDQKGSAPLEIVPSISCVIIFEILGSEFIIFCELYPPYSFNFIISSVLRPNINSFSSPASLRISRFAPSSVPSVTAPFIMNFMFPVPLASFPAVEICSLISAAG